MTKRRTPGCRCDYCRTDGWKNEPVTAPTPERRSKSEAKRLATQAGLDHTEYCRTGIWSVEDADGPPQPSALRELEADMEQARRLREPPRLIKWLALVRRAQKEKQNG